MNERDFCYWLQGLMEVGRIETLDAVQVQQIKDHLNLVFNKVTPSILDKEDKLKYCTSPFFEWDDKTEQWEDIRKNHPDIVCNKNFETLQDVYDLPPELYCYYTNTPPVSC